MFLYSDTERTVPVVYVIPRRVKSAPIDKGLRNAFLIYSSDMHKILERVRDKAAGLSTRQLCNVISGRLANQLKHRTKVNLPHLLFDRYVHVLPI